MVSIIYVKTVLDIMMSVRDVYHRWETIKGIFRTLYGCN